MTGLTRAGRSHVSQAHAIPARPALLARRSWLYLEVHDTGPTLAPTELDDLVHASSGGRAASSARGRVHALAVARELAAALGGALHVDSTPGCGTQALLLLPLDEDDAPPGPPTIETCRTGR
jgi:signal transduction histidine kinase